MRRLRIGSENLLVLLTAVSVIAGIGMGIGIKANHDLSPRQVSFLKFPGEIFLRLLKMIILPLIFSSIVTSLATLEAKTAGKLGLYTVLYYLSTTICAVVIGIILVVSIRPGRYGYDPPEDAKDKPTCDGSHPIDTVLDLIRNMFPDNIAEATIQAVRTCYSAKKLVNGSKWSSISVAELEEINNASTPGIRAYFVPFLETKSGLNILGIVTFAIVFGLILGSFKQQCKTMLDFFISLEFIIMKLVHIIIWFSPIGIMFLIAAQIVETRNLLHQLKNLGLYMATVLTGLFIHGVIVLPAVLYFVGKRNPLKFAGNLVQALLTALGTSSSSATMPVTLRCLEEKNHIHEKVTRFMIPLGATINMDGTALYEAVAAIYIAQATKSVINFGHILLISITATLASIGAAGIPQAGLVTMIMVLTAVGLDAELFVLILPVDWFLDRIRTTVNVWGDSVGTGVVQRLCASVLKPDTDEYDLEKVENTAETDSLNMTYYQPKANGELPAHEANGGPKNVVTGDGQIVYDQPTVITLEPVGNKPRTA